jgi:hypothetical protein
MIVDGVLGHFTHNRPRLEKSMPFTPMLCGFVHFAISTLGLAPVASAQVLSADFEQAVPAARSSHPNEPAGFTALSDREFNDRVEAGWRSRPGRNFSIASDPTAPVSPPSVGRAEFPAGYRGGRGPIDTYLEFGERDYRSIYVSTWIKLSDNFEGAPSNGINKLFHIWIGGKSVVVLSLQGRGRGQIFPQMRLQNVQGGGRGVSFNISPGRGSSARIERGRWHHVEILLRVNAPGQVNGEVHWWVDGRKAGQDMRVGFRRQGMDASWERVSWNPTWGAPRDTVRELMTISMDQLYVSGMK